MPLKRSLFFAGTTRLLAMGLALAGLGGCAPQRPVAQTEQSSHTGEKPRVVSLNPCIDAILVDIAQPGQVLALSHYSRDPASSSVPTEIAGQYRFTGGTVEEVLALSPDLVLASSFMPPATRNAFERLGLKIETFGSPASVAESAAQIERIGKLTGNIAAARKLAGEITGLGTAEQPEEITTLLWQPGQIVPGEATLVGELMRRNGLVSHAQAMDLKQADYVSLERVLAEPPELLLVAGKSAGQDHPLLERLTETRVEQIDTHLLYCGGRTIIALQDRLNSIRTDLDWMDAGR